MCWGIPAACASRRATSQPAYYLAYFYDAPLMTYPGAGRGYTWLGCFMARADESSTLVINNTTYIKQANPEIEEATWSAGSTTSDPKGSENHLLAYGHWGAMMPILRGQWRNGSCTLPTRILGNYYRAFPFLYFSFIVRYIGIHRSASARDSQPNLHLDFTSSNTAAATCSPSTQPVPPHCHYRATITHNCISPLSSSRMTTP